MSNEEEQSYPVTPSQMEEVCQKAARYGAFNMWIQLRGQKKMGETWDDFAGYLKMAKEEVARMVENYETENIEQDIDNLEKVKEIDNWLHNLFMAYWKDMDVWRFEETYQIMCEKGSSTFDESKNFAQNMQHCVGRIQKEYGCMSKFFRKVGEGKVEENASRYQY